jgi:hypothetical protein
LREITPVDPALQAAISNPKNQKERVRYTFTPKRLDAVTRDVDALTDDIGKFMDAAKGFPPLTLPELWLSPPFSKWAQLLQGHFGSPLANL